MSAVPSGFSLELYQDTVSDAMNEPVRLLLADGNQLLLPESSELSEFEQQRVRSLLADEHPGTALCCEQKIESLPGTSLRLLALASGLKCHRNETFVPHLQRVLGRVGQCINHVWSL